MTGLLSIGVSGIKAAQLGLLATEHNIVNAYTPGYSRQSTVQGTNISVMSGAGSIGQGVNVATIRRSYDSYLTKQVNTAQTEVSRLESMFSQMSQIDLMLADPSAGLSPALQDFFSGVQQVSANPSSLPARQLMLTSAETMVSRFQNMESRLGQIGEQLNGRIENAVADINTYSREIADINQRIVIAEAGYGQPPNDLLDQRDQLVLELNKLVKVTATVSSDGSYNVFMGSGQQLVVGGLATEVTAEPSTIDSSRIVVGLKTAGDNTLELPESLIVGGELGGLISFRNRSLDRAENELGRVAVSLTLTFNAQFGLGQNLLGKVAEDGPTQFEGTLFSVPEPKVLPDSFNDGSGDLSVSFLPPEAPTAPNFSGAFYTNLVPSDYEVTFGAGGDFSVRRLQDNAVVLSGTGTGVVEFDGLSLDISTVGDDGDRFVIQPFEVAARDIALNTRVAADPRLVNAAAPMRTTPGLANTGSMTLSQGMVGIGYSVSGLPQTLTAGRTGATGPATYLSGVGGNWTATYSDGTELSGTGGDIELLNSGATLRSITLNDNNMSFKVDGAPAVGDSFTIERNIGGVQDGRNAIAFAALQTSNTMAGGTATYQSAYAKMVADNGILTRETKIRLEAQNAVLTAAQNSRDSLSAVNLDEEAANMMKFQQAYQAAAKVLEIGGTLFDTILSIR